jgi:hypothetical protein
MQTQTFLRRALGIDAIASGALGLLMLVTAQPLSALLGLPTTLLSGAGVALLPWAAWVGWLASRPMPPRLQVWFVIALNVVWVIESAILLIGDSVQPTSLGIAFVIAQAAAVGVFAELQYFGIRRTTRIAT